jgi:hypothetical protein
MSSFSLISATKYCDIDKGSSHMPWEKMGISLYLKCNIIIIQFNSILIFQFNTYLFTCKLNSPEANYKVSTSKK